VKWLTTLDVIIDFTDFSPAFLANHQKFLSRQLYTYFR